MLNRDGNIQVEYPYHLCPVCGMQSGSTSRVCPKHISVTSDTQGNVLRYTDYILNWEYRRGVTPTLALSYP